MKSNAPTFEEFWPEYVRSHSNKVNRTLHVIGMSLALGCVAGAIFKRKPWLLAAAPVVGYAFAWSGHFFVEKNVPTTFRHPLYSVRANAKLWWMTIIGEMDDEVKRVLENKPREHESPAAQTAMN